MKPHLRNSMAAEAWAAGVARPDGCAGCKGKLPPLAIQARNFAGAVVRHVAGGMKQATPDQQSARQAICRTCEHWRAHDQRCAKCACYTAAKTAWLNESCPVGKW